MTYIGNINRRTDPLILLLLFNLYPRRPSLGLGLLLLLLCSCAAEGGLQADGAVCALDESERCDAAGEGGDGVGDEGGQAEEDGRKDEGRVDMRIYAGERGGELVDRCRWWRGGRGWGGRCSGARGWGLRNGGGGCC